jgi:YesN/AraC family two-component response regulator
LKGADVIDLLFTDVVMPKGMNGFELAEEATSHHNGLRVLLTSGYPETELEKSGLPDSKFRLLRKLYSNEELSDALKPILEV